MTRRRKIAAVAGLLGLLAITSGVVVAQDWFGPGGFGGRGGMRGRNRPGVMPADRAGVPDWEIDPELNRDVFTFVRLEYDSYGGRGRGGWGGGWATDWPDSDLNFSYRLQQLTSMKVNPDPITLRLTDDRLFDYPFLYMIEPGSLSFSEEEVLAFRRYLLNGGFVMVDDFWGEYAWENLRREMARVFPDRQPVELGIDHEIFRCVYPLREKPQVPSIHSWEQYGRTITYEPRHGPGSEEVHYRALFDDKGRMMALFCHNTDLGDGWEREGEDPSYFREFSEKKSYPMGINIISYVMSH